jgi:hypothetical protein
MTNSHESQIEMECFNTPKPLTSSSHPNEGVIRTGDAGSSDACDVRLGPKHGATAPASAIPPKPKSIHHMQCQVVNLCDLIATLRPIGALPLAPDHAEAAAEPTSRIGSVSTLETRYKRKDHRNIAKKAKELQDVAKGAKGSGGS